MIYVYEVTHGVAAEKTRLHLPNTQRYLGVRQRLENMGYTVNLVDAGLDIQDHRSEMEKQNADLLQDLAS